MLALGLTTAQYRELRRRLATSYTMKVTVQVLTPEHKLMRTVENKLLAGTVDVTTPKRDGDQVEISRTASLRFFDPRFKLAIDDRSPADTAIYLNRMIRVIVSIRCSFGWVDIPVFTGPVVDVNRDGYNVDVECCGKEVWALGDAVETGTVRGNRDDVTRELLRRSGEVDRYMQIPPGGGKSSVSIARDSKLWIKAWKVQAAAGRVLFYDGRGNVKARKKPMKTAITLRTGDGGGLWAPPKVAYAIDDNVKNYIRVVGRKPAKGKTRPSAIVAAPPWHDLSPKKLGRNGRNLYKADFIETDATTNAECKRIGSQRLEESLMQSVTGSIECMPIYDLEPWDIVQVVNDDMTIRMRANTFTIPLVQDGEGEAMTIGVLKNTKRFVQTRHKKKRRR